MLSSGSGPAWPGLEWHPMKSRGLMRSSWPRRIPIAALPLPTEYGLTRPQHSNLTLSLARSLRHHPSTCFFRVLGFRGDGHHHDLHPCRMLLAQINSNSGRTSPCNRLDRCSLCSARHPSSRDTGLPSTLSGLAVGKLWPVQFHRPSNKGEPPSPDSRTSDLPGFA